MNVTSWCFGVSLDPLDDSVMVDDVTTDDHTSSSASDNEDLSFYHYSKVATYTWFKCIDLIICFVQGLVYTEATIDPLLN